MEIWKEVPIDGFGHLYQISDQGRLKSLERKIMFGPHLITRREKIVMGSPDKNGYLIYCIKDKAMNKNVKIHRLVAQAFIPNPENKPFVNHLNGIKNDNRVQNLEWCTGKENSEHAIATGLFDLTKEILQKNIDGTTKEWSSITDILKAGVISRTHLHRVIKRKMVYQNATWHYKNQ